MTGTTLTSTAGQQIHAVGKRVVACLTTWLTMAILLWAPISWAIDARNDDGGRRHQTSDGVPIVVDVLSNDNDDGNGPLTIISAGPSGSGNVSIINTSTGQQVLFEPTPGTAPPASTVNRSFNYQIRDALGNTDTAIVTIEINGINGSEPILALAIPDQMLAEDFPAQSPSVPAGASCIDLRNHFTDTLTAIDDLKFQAFSDNSANAVLTLLEDPNVNYTQGGPKPTPFLCIDPIADAFGIANVTVTARDLGGQRAQDTFILTVNSVNDTPVANNDPGNSIDEDNLLTLNVIANDSDIEDGNNLTITSVGASSLGAVVTIVGNQIQYDPRVALNSLAGGQNSAVDTISYQIEDQQGAGASASFDVIVIGVNDDPVTVDDTASTDEDTLVVTNVISNDSDVDSSFTLTNATSTGLGSVSFNSNSINFDPSGVFDNLAQGASTTETITYTITDDQGGTAIGQLTVTINGSNDAPVAANDNQSTDEDTAVSVSVLNNDNDVDGTITITNAVGSGLGVVSFTASSINFDPRGAFDNLTPVTNATETITYTITDDSGATSSADLIVTITGINDNPVALDDTAATDEDTLVTANVLTNDSDVDGTVTITNATSTGLGVVNFTASSISFDPRGAFDNLASLANATETITYTITDDLGASTTANLVVTINGANDAPVALDDAASTDEDTLVTANVLTNDSDVDGSITITNATASQGSVTFTGSSISFDPSGAFDNLAQGASVDQTITYTVTDDAGATTSADLIVTITGINDNPVALDDTAATDEDTLVTANVLTNDSDVDGTVTITNATSTGLGVVNFTASSISFDPRGAFDNLTSLANATETITYTITDDLGASTTANLVVTINGANDAPVALDDAASTDEDTLVTANVLTNDSDVDGSITITNATASQGSVTFTGSSISFDPSGAFDSLAQGASVDQTITYTVTDDAGATTTADLVVTITGINDNPVALDDTAATDEDTLVTANVLTNDSDVDGTVTITNATSTGLGVVNFTASSISFDPRGAFDNLTSLANATETITYTITDDLGASTTANLVVTINGANDAPVALDDAVSTDEETLVTANVLTNDSDVDGSITITNATASQGSVTFTGSSISFDPSGAFDSLAQGATVTQSITYTITDDAGATTTARLIVTVTGVNDSPVALDDTASTTEAASVVVNVLDNDSDVDSGDQLNVVAVSGGSPGTSVTIQASNKRIIYDPAGALESLANGATRTETISYTVEDTQGVQTSATVIVTVNGLNDTPVANNDVASVSENATVSVDVLANDTDIDTGDVAGFVVQDNPVSITSSKGAVVTFSASGATYDPSGLFENLSVGDTDTDTFTYTMRDAQGASALAQVTITITGENDSPLAVNDLVSIPENTATTISVLANDTDIDQSDTLVLGSVPAASTNGVPLVQIGNAVQYQQSNQFDNLAVAEGLTDSFTYTINDGQGATSTATVTINITGVNDSPVANNDAATTDEETSVTIDLVANDTDLDSSDVLSVVSVSGGTGALTLAGNQVTYNPSGLFDGLLQGSTTTDTFNYVLTDGQGANVTASVTVTISGINDNPIANDDNVVTDEDSQVSFNVLGNDTDVDSGDTLTIINVDATSSQGAALNIDANQVRYTPGALFQPIAQGDSRTDTFSYTLQDSAGVTSTASVTVTVNGLNDLPVAETDSGIGTDEDNTITIDVLANDTDIDNPDTLSIASVDANSLGNATLSIQGNSIVYNPNAQFEGLNNGDTITDTFSYIVVDSQGATAEGVVAVTITGINDNPIGQVDSYTVVESGALDVAAAQGLLANDTDVDNIDAVDISVGAGGTLDLVASIVTAPQHGQIAINPDGSFGYRPDINYFNDSGDNGALVPVEFCCGPDFVEYRITDGNGGISDLIRVEFTVVAAQPIVFGPGSTVNRSLDLAQRPLELGLGVESNVMVIGDDSGSMDFDMVINGTAAKGTNEFREPSGSNSSFGWEYSLNFDNRISIDHQFLGDVVPSEEAFQARDSGLANRFGVWRVRTPAFNRLYYNPEIRYEPWSGLDLAGNPYTDSDPRAARLNPNEAPTVDLTQPTTPGDNYRVTYPRANLTRDPQRLDGFYIPRYYTFSDSNGNGDVDASDAHNLIEIKPGSFYQGGNSRTDCVTNIDAPLTCSYDEELQNFANWFTYYRRREFVLKASLGQVVSRIDSVRVGYAPINSVSGLTREPITTLNLSSATGTKRELLNTIYRVGASGGTPLRRALASAGRYFECRAGDIFGSTAASAPGSAGCPVLPEPSGTCQQNYTLLFTDGARNGPNQGFANNDGDGSSDFDGRPFTTPEDLTRGAFADGLSDTLADIAMDFYERDLHPTLADDVKTTVRDRALAEEAAFGANINTMHQHMTTYTIGFGIDGTLGADVRPASFTTAFNWPTPVANQSTAVDDLIHAGFNGRGDYLNGNDPVALLRNFRQIFNEVVAGQGAATAVSFNTQEVQQDTILFRAFFNTILNTGDLEAQRLELDANGNVRIDGNGIVQLTPVWSAAEQLNPRDPNDRIIITYDSFLNNPPEGIPFRFASLNSRQQGVLNEDQVNYLRGDTSNEQPVGSLRQRPQSNRKLGDIVNSTPVFVGSPTAVKRDREPFPLGDGAYSLFRASNEDRTQVIYVGANDGLMHAFYADDDPDDSSVRGGDELFAYVPERIINGNSQDTDGTTSANMADILTDPVYAHNYFVDLTPAVNDVYIKSSRTAIEREWQTILMGGLRGGGRGYFALNINNPDSITDENSAAEKVMWEFSDTDDAGVGFSYSAPTLTMSNVEADDEQRWVAVIGNGYNSQEGNAVLYVLFIEDGLDGTWDSSDFIKLDTGFGPFQTGVDENGAGIIQPNGLGTPRAVDIDGDGTVDIVYAGDLQGNLFRFDLRDSNPGNWSSTRLFTAEYDEVLPAQRQPITTRPVVIRHPTEPVGFIVVFGTGSYIVGGSNGDATNEDIQSMYGVWDRLEINPSINRTDLIEQSITNISIPGLGFLRTLTDRSINWLVERGWYIDFDAPPAGSNPGAAPEFPGERPLRNIQLRGGRVNGINKQFVFINTVIPQEENSCVLGVGGFQMAFSPATGGTVPGDSGSSETAAFDINNDGNFDENDLIDVQQADGTTIKKAPTGLRFDSVPSDSTFIGDQRFTQLSNRDIIAVKTNTQADSSTGRLSWRELDEIVQ